MKKKKLIKRCQHGSVLQKLKFSRIPIDLNNGYKIYADKIYETHDVNGNSNGDLPPVLAGRTIYVTPYGNDTVFYTNKDIFEDTPQKDNNQAKSKNTFYKLIRKAPIVGEENRMTKYWNKTAQENDEVRIRALRGN